MIDQSTPKGRIVASALRLAAERPWRDVTLNDIAAGANVTLAELRAEAGTKSGILAAFTRQIDATVLAAKRSTAPGQSVRDQLFDVIMARFDALQPYRAGLRSIFAHMNPTEPRQVEAFLTSQAWMLAAAGISPDGIKGRIKAAGLASLYASVFRTWLDDDDAGLARTMASLDRRLRRGEGTVQTLRDIERKVCRVACAFVPGGRSKSGTASATQPQPPAGSGGGEHPMPS